MFQCMNMHICYIYHLRNTHAIMFHEMYAVTDTTDRMKAQSRFGTLSNLCFFVNNQLEAQFFFLCIFLFSTCFGQPCAHRQEN